jgi:hypothetical protein
LLIDENNRVSEIDFYVAQHLINQVLEENFDKVVLSFSTKIP